MNHRWTLLALVAAGCARAGGPGAPAPQPAVTLPERLLPQPVPVSSAFRSALERGTRTRTGQPGPNYWQQFATYRIEAELDPSANRLAARARVRYENRSPETLRQIYLHLHHNIFEPSAMRNEEVPATGGIRLTRVAAGGETLEARRPGAGAGYSVSGTALRLQPANPVAPGQAIEMEFAWTFEVPPEEAPRMGQDGQVWYLAYWYPQVAVFDDISRWHTDPYLGNAEFYMGYADYDVSITVPEGWLVSATGTLANADQVLGAATRQRLAEARRTGAVVQVVGDADRGAGRATSRGQNGKLTWRFAASNVRDFAFGASDRYLWDAASVAVGDADGDGRPDTAMVHTFYRPERRAWAWDHSARFSRHSLDFLSRFLWPYPYPQMSVVDGVVGCGGMEYPMLTCIGGRRDTLSLYSVIVHEIAHMWFPMAVGSDEKRYSWQDEGLTTFNQAEAMREFFNGYDSFERSRPGYVGLARMGGEVELMRHGDLYPLGSPAFGIASYAKMALNMRSLRAILGDSVFQRAYREYGRRWSNRHPTPHDFFNTFEDVSGRDLSWFWRAWWYETWTLDQAIASVRPAGADLEVVIEDRGMAPMPVLLSVTRQGGATDVVTVPVEVWLRGARRHVLRVPRAATVTRLEIDPGQAFPDVDRTNQSWTP